MDTHQINGDKPQSPPKQSDFSIDHILNRAGANVARSSPTSSPPSSDFCSNMNRTHFAPPFDWLYYTRYHPPRLQRQSKTINGPIKRTPGRLPRIPFTPFQLESLENAYKISTYLSSEDANRLGKQLDLTSTRVKIWFQNRRARERREHKVEDLRIKEDSATSNGAVVRFQAVLRT